MSPKHASVLTLTFVLAAAACGPGGPGAEPGEGPGEGPGNTPGTPSPIPTEMQQASDPVIDEIFDISAPMYGVTARAESAIILGPESAAPAEARPVELAIPAELAGSRAGIKVFAEVYEGNEEELLDVFVPLATELHGDKLLAQIPPEAFMDRDGKGEFKAVLMLAVAPSFGRTGSGLRVGRTSSGLLGQGCGNDVPHIPSALDSARVRSGFSLTRSNAMVGIAATGHPATDFVADDVPVYSQGPGTVVEVRESRTTYDPTWTTAQRVAAGRRDNGGFGGTVVIKSQMGATIRYAHLKAGSILVAVGDEVGCHQQIATTGNTGASTGPHLHLEYRPTGGTRVDPAACTDLGYEGTIDVDQTAPTTFSAHGVVELGLCLEDGSGSYYNMTGEFQVTTSILLSDLTCTLAPNKGPVADTDMGSTTELQVYWDQRMPHKHVSYDLDFTSEWPAVMTCTDREGRTFALPEAEFPIIYATFSAGCMGEDRLPVTSDEHLMDQYTMSCYGMTTKATWDLRKKTQ